MSLKSISPVEARRLLAEGALLVDIREADEHARENIPGAKLLPLSEIKPGHAAGFDGAKAVIFHCLSGARTRANAERLKTLTSCEAYLVEGGLSAWRQAGFPIRVDRKQPLPIMRQVQIGAGALALTGVVLGYLVSPWLFLISAFVGAGLLQAGVTGWCGMAQLLQAMPWNRQPAASR
jgi:rhodanese-related sulfurtransferase